MKLFPTANFKNMAPYKEMLIIHPDSWEGENRITKHSCAWTGKARYHHGMEKGKKQHFLNNK